jgi:hypothetical protein
MSLRREEQREIEEQNLVRCLLVHLPISLSLCSTNLLAHATVIATVVMVAGATVARQLLLRLHHHRRL